MRLDLALTREGNTTLHHGVYRSHRTRYREYIAGEYGELRQEGYWYPDLELTVAGRGYRTLIPKAAPGLETWLPPAVGQFNMRPARDALERFRAAIDELNGEASNRQPTIATIDVLGGWLARRGKWPRCMNRLCRTPGLRQK